MLGEQLSATSASELRSKHTCPLLELLGELRNHIYDFAIENRVIMFTPRRTQENESKRPKYVKSSIFKRITNSDAPKGFPFICQEADEERRSKRAIRQFRGLTQVCRLIRREYLPRYKRMVAHRVCHVDLENYVNMALIPECQRLGQQAVPAPTGDIVDTKAYYDAMRFEQLKARQYITRNVYVDCKTWEERAGMPPVQLPFSMSVDILPFLKFCMTAPGIHAQCGLHTCVSSQSDWDGMKDNIKRLFEAGKHPKLAAWLKESVDEVWLHYNPFISFAMKKGHGRRWMDNWNKGIDSVDMRLWEADVGLWGGENGLSDLGFECFRADWGRYYGRDGVDIEKMKENEEEETFWETIDKTGKKRSKKPRRKVKCEKAKLGRNKGRQRLSS